MTQRRLQLPRRWGCAELRIALLTLGLLTCGGSCTLVTDFTPEQCSVDADCEALVDRPARICEEQRCRSGCGSHAQCAGLGEDMVCPARGEPCRSLRSEDESCFNAMHELRNSASGTLEEAAVIGAFAPRRFDSNEQLALQLAAEQLNVTGGLPGAAGAAGAAGAGLSPVVVVVCDDKLETLPGAMSHLLDDLGAKALLSSLDPRVLREAVERYDPQGRAFFLSPFNAWGVVESSERLWYLLGGTKDLLPSYQAAVDAYRQGQGQQARARVAAWVADDELADSQLADTVLGAPLWGDRPLAAARDVDFARFSSRQDDTQRQVALEALIAHRPELILLFASRGSLGDGTAQREGAIAELERHWPSDVPPPRYLLSPRNYRSQAVESLVSAHPGLSQRLLGVNFSTDGSSEVAQSFASAFANRFPQASPVVNPAFYDGVYYLGYALSAALREGKPLDAEAVSEGFLNVTDPTAERLAVGSGEQSMDRAFALLRNGERFFLRGVTGEAEFHATEHYRVGGSSLYCPAVSEQGEISWQDVDEFTAPGGPCSDWGGQ